MQITILWIKLSLTISIKKTNTYQSSSLSCCNLCKERGSFMRNFSTPHRPPFFHMLSRPFQSFEVWPYIKLPPHPSPHGQGHRGKPWLTWSSPKRQSFVKERSFKQDRVTAQSSEPLNSVWITATKTHKNRKPRAKFMISRNRKIIS